MNRHCKESRRFTPTSITKRENMESRTLGLKMAILGSKFKQTYLSKDQREIFARERPEHCR